MIQRRRQRRRRLLLPLLLGCRSKYLWLCVKQKTHYKRRTLPDAAATLTSPPSPSSSSKPPHQNILHKWQSNKFSMTAQPKIATTAAVIKLNKTKRKKGEREGEGKKQLTIAAQRQMKQSKTKEPISSLSTAFSISNGHVFSLCHFRIVIHFILSMLSKRAVRASEYMAENCREVLRVKAPSPKSEHIYHQALPACDAPSPKFYNDLLFLW